VNLAHVPLTLGKELRETLRDRRTLAMMILFPLVIYPLLALAVSQVVIKKEAKREARPSRVALAGTGPVADELRDRLAAERKVFALAVNGTAADVDAGRLDALVIVAPPPARRAEVVHDASRDESREAADRIDDLLAGVLPEGCTRMAVKKTDVASGARLGGYLLSKGLPLVLVLMVLLGAFYPAIDVTAGERERGTLETVLVAPIGRFELLLGKVLAVALIAALTGVLNLVSMTATLLQAFQMADTQASLPIPWLRAAASTVVILPAAFLFGALFVAIGSTARGFKEAQNFLMPVYFLGIAPALVGAVGEYPLTAGTALVPVMNVTLLARELLLGKAHLGTAALVLVSTAACGCAALAMAARLYDSERFVDLAAGAKSATTPGGAAPPPAGASADTPPTAGEALAMFAVGFLLLWFVFVPWQRRNLVVGLLATQWLGMLGLVVVLARLRRRRLAAMIALRRPPGGVLAGAAVIGASAWAVVALLSEWLVPVPREVIEQLRKALIPEDGRRPLVVNLLLVALTPAVCEEALFRGAILRGLATRMAPAAAIVCTGVLFGIFHLDLFRLLPSTLLGILLSWLAWRTGSLIPSMAAHFINNAILITLTTYRVEDRLAAMGKPVSAAVFAGALLLVVGGVVLVRRGGRRSQM
jgi:sodium transport system permease protein